MEFFTKNKFVKANEKAFPGKIKQQERDDQNEAKKMFLDEGSNISRMSGYEEAMLRMNLQCQGETLIIDETQNNYFELNLKKNRSTPTGTHIADTNICEFEDISEDLDETDEINDETMLDKPDEDDEEEKYEVICSVMDDDNDILDQIEDEKEEKFARNIFNEMYCISDSNEGVRQMLIYKYENDEEELFNRVVDYIDPVTF